MSLTELKSKYSNKPFVWYHSEVSFLQYGLYPALEFFSENMKKICYLEADISIDPYDVYDPYDLY